MRKPDFIIGEIDSPYLLRWWLIPRNKYFNIYLHKFCRSDDDQALHDHPWFNISFILKGKYTEHMPADRYKWISNGDREVATKTRYPLIPVFRDSNSIHRVELIKGKPVWTLFITGPWRRNWGFWCPFGWRPWREFVSITKGGNETGRGCE